MRHRVLAKVTKVVVLGSYLRADVDRLSDLDIAVELQPKEANWDRLRELTLKRVEQLQMAGRGFRNWLEMEYWWHREAFGFLKNRSRTVSLRAPSGWRCRANVERVRPSRLR